MESDEAEDDSVPRLINVGPESLGAFRGLRHLFFDCSCTWSMVYTLRYVVGLSRPATLQALSAMLGSLQWLSSSCPPCLW